MALPRLLRSMERTDIAEIFRYPPTELLEGLRGRDLLPRIDEDDLVAADVRAFDVTDAPLVRLDPRHPHVGDHGMYASFPSGLHTFFDPPELLIWGTGNNLSYLILYFQGLAAGSYAASIDLQVWTTSTVAITATGSAGLSVGAGPAVTFTIPVSPNAEGTAVISMTPGSQTQGFSWFGTSLLPA